MLTNENFDLTFREREEGKVLPASGIIYYIRLKDATTYCEDGNPVKLDHTEARQLQAQRGEGLEAIIAARVGKYPKAETAQVKHVKRGRPKKNGK